MSPRLGLGARTRRGYAALTRRAVRCRPGWGSELGSAGLYDVARVGARTRWVMWRKFTPTEGRRTDGGTRADAGREGTAAENLWPFYVRAPKALTPSPLHGEREAYAEEPHPSPLPRRGEEYRLETDEFFFLLATGSGSVQIILVGRAFVVGCPISILPPSASFKLWSSGREHGICLPFQGVPASNGPGLRTAGPNRRFLGETRRRTATGRFGDWPILHFGFVWQNGPHCSIPYLGLAKATFICTNSSVFERVFTINKEIAQDRILLCCNRID